MPLCLSTKESKYSRTHTHTHTHTRACARAHTHTHTHIWAWSMESRLVCSSWLAVPCAAIRPQRYILRLLVQLTRGKSPLCFLRHEQTVLRAHTLPPPHPVTPPITFTLCPHLPEQIWLLSLPSRRRGLSLRYPLDWKQHQTGPWIDGGWERLGKRPLLLGIGKSHWYFWVTCCPFRCFKDLLFFSFSACSLPACGKGLPVSTVWPFRPFRPSSRAHGCHQESNS